MSAGTHRLHRRLDQTGAALLGIGLIVWTILPLYNMVMISLEAKEDVFASNILPPAPTLDGFRTVLNEGFWLLANFWHQMGNSF